jgi:molecular chaperone DnaK
MWSWLKSLLGRDSSAPPRLQLSPPSPSIPRPPSSTPRLGESLRALGWGKQDTIPESEFVYTTESEDDDARTEAMPILGIDLGTTHSVVAVLREGKAEVIPNQEGQLLTPSVVAFTEAGDILVGERAQQRAIQDPGRTVFSIKRLLARTANEVRAWSDLFACEIVSGPREYPEVRIDGRSYTPVEILAAILGKLKDAAERHLGRPARRAVMTVPTLFTDAQRHAVLAAAELAGFDVDWILKDSQSGHKVRQRMRIVSEPTAAALGLGYGRENRRLAVFHMGGGTFDITFLDVGQDVVKVEAVGGDTCLGGDDFDQVLMEHLIRQLPGDVREKSRLDAVARQRLRLAAEQAKRDLSHRSQVSLDLPWLSRGIVKLRLTVTRTELEQLVQPLVEKCRRLVMLTLAEAGWQVKDIDEVLSLGGMTRMPALRQLFRDLFPGRSHRAVNLDEVVALGAAVLGRQLDLGRQAELLVLDVTPLSLGVETADGEFVILVPRNATIPFSRNAIFTVAADDQPGVSIRVFQEESGTAGRRKYLGQLDLEGLNGPRGQTKVEVTFDLDPNGILRVTARDLASGREKSMRMVPRLPAVVSQLHDQIHQGILHIEKLLRTRGRDFAPSAQEPLRRLLHRSRLQARKEDVRDLREVLQELEAVRDAMTHYLNGHRVADSPYGFSLKRSSGRSGRDPDLEI